MCPHQSLLFHTLFPSNRNAIWPECLLALSFLRLQHVFFMETVIFVFLVNSVLRNENFPIISQSQVLPKNQTKTSLSRYSSNLIIPSRPPATSPVTLYARESVIWPSWGSPLEVCLLSTNALTFFLEWFSSSLLFVLWANFFEILRPFSWLSAFDEKPVNFVGGYFGQEELEDV